MHILAQFCHGLAVPFPVSSVSGCPPSSVHIVAHPQHNLSTQPPSTCSCCHSTSTSAPHPLFAGLWKTFSVHTLFFVPGRSAKPIFEYFQLLKMITLFSLCPQCLDLPPWSPFAWPARLSPISHPHPLASDPHHSVHFVVSLYYNLALHHSRLGAPPHPVTSWSCYLLTDTLQIFLLNLNRKEWLSVKTYCKQYFLPFPNVYTASMDASCQQMQGRTCLSVNVRDLI